MNFQLLGEITEIETFATGRGKWRKRKGFAWVRLSDGSTRFAEVHWYEATGIGRKELKVKRLAE